MMPAGLYKQFPTELRERFVINRSVFQKCLVLYPMDAWEEIVKDLGKLNRFRKENDDFIRQYTNGASTVELDATNRFLLPKHLVDFAKIKKDIVLTSSLNKIEIWSDKAYKDVMKSYDPDAFAQLAEKVMGGHSNQESQ
jgi:MraZ protein